MKKQKRFGLMAQLTVIFTAITVISSLLFITIFRSTLSNVTKIQAERDFIYFSKELAKTKKNEVYINEYYAYVAYVIDSDVNILSVHRDMTKPFIDIEAVNSFVANNQGNIKQNNESNKIINDNNLHYYYIVNEIDGDLYLIITISDDTFENSLKEPVNNIVIIGFLSLIILGNAIILLWTSVTVERIRNLKIEIYSLSDSSYKKPIVIEGHDEITDLSEIVENMRVEIVKNEEIKQEMLQNLSHDIKTPISVIKSYAEAIKDGISDVEDIDVIIKQTNILTEKIFKLIEWNRLEYIKEKEEFYPVDIKRIIKTVVHNQKFKRDIEFILNLDNSYLEGLDDYYFSMINNIVENALRYAKTTIKITLENKKITIYNDGDPIDEKFLNNDFRPYQKGYKGQFGLGLSIVSKTAEKFNLKLCVKNINDGVEFTIEPL